VADVETRRSEHSRTAWKDFLNQARVNSWVQVRAAVFHDKESVVRISRPSGHQNNYLSWSEVLCMTAAMVELIKLRAVLMLSGFAESRGRYLSALLIGNWRSNF